MAIAQLAMAMTNTGTAGTSATLVAPAGISAGDIIVIRVSRRNITNDVTATGFTVDSSWQMGTVGRITLLTKVAAGTESGTTISPSWVTASGYAASLVVFTGVDSSIWDTGRTGSDGTSSITLPSLTIVTANAWYLAAVISNIASSGAVTWPAGAWTTNEEADAGNGGTTTTRISQASSHNTIGVGATGTVAVTSTGGTTASLDGALMPAGGAPAATRPIGVMQVRGPNWFPQGV